MDMTSNNTMQFYIDRLVNASDLIKPLSDAVGITLETLEYPNEQADGFIMLLEYNVGFPLGVNVSWRRCLSSNGAESAVKPTKLAEPSLQSSKFSGFTIHNY